MKSTQLPASKGAHSPVARTLRGLQIKCKWNNTELARQVGVSPMSVTRWLAGTDCPNEASLAQLAIVSARNGLANYAEFWTVCRNAGKLGNLFEALSLAHFMQRHLSTHLEQAEQALNDCRFEVALKRISDARVFSNRIVEVIEKINPQLSEPTAQAHHRTEVN
jgi:hypothetical protein